LANEHVFAAMRTLPQHIRAEARRLRRVEGWSFAAIARQLGVAPSTVRLWTLDIELTPGQRADLDASQRANRLRGSAVMAEAFRDRRRSWQRHGREWARKGNRLHLAGCLLYWAEGTKNRNVVQLVNSDLHLVRLFLRFLRECFAIGDRDIALSLHLYTGNGLTIRQVEDRWLTGLDLPRDCLRKHSINKRPAPTSGIKKNKLPYGVATLQIARSTWLVQHIYGAIQEYAGFDEPRWLDGPHRRARAA
jgi:hypothetical protein